MEALSPKFELSPVHVSTKSPKPTSLQFCSYRLSCLNRSSGQRRCFSLPSSSNGHSVRTEPVRRPPSDGHDWIKSIRKGLLGCAAAATALASVYCDSPAFAESLTVAFPVSRASEVIPCFDSIKLLLFLWFRFMLWLSASVLFFIFSILSFAKFCLLIVICFIGDGLLELNLLLLKLTCLVRIAEDMRVVSVRWIQCKELLWRLGVWFEKHS